ncbi:hypothetical protein EMA8858_03902 [Emticicia aquatica]|uniref:Uncharacterized protein n=2 Tax=Emticicia aquatica TaxID=1681835 RepID=A0ABM9AUR2_9BACT|nr:hypothetical protein EMA8858_03902 [Emticicia aquatica]
MELKFSYFVCFLNKPQSHLFYHFFIIKLFTFFTNNMDIFRLYSKKENSNTSIVFDDSCFDNIKGKTLSTERSQEIENLLMPKLMAAFEELKKTNPLFQKKNQR